MKTRLLITAALSCATSIAFAACSRDAQAVTPQSLEQQYGVSGAYNESVSTPDGKVPGTIVPVTLANGQSAQLFIPAKQAREPHAIYMRDNDGLHPVHVKPNATRDEVTKAPAIAEKQPEPAHANKRTWEKEALIIGGAAGGGAAIGAVTGGKKGAAIGAAAGGIGGLIYDMATRDKK
jgi:hypothetical protein